MYLDLESLWLLLRLKSERAEVRTQQFPDERISYNNRHTLALKMVVCPVFSIIIIVLYFSFCIVPLPGAMALRLP